jgi:hypothetical protein
MCPQIRSLQGQESCYVPRMNCGMSTLLGSLITAGMRRRRVSGRLASPTEWPQTAVVLRNLAEMYDKDAREETRLNGRRSKYSALAGSSLAVVWQHKNALSATAWEVLCSAMRVGWGPWAADSASASSCSFRTSFSGRCGVPSGTPAALGSAAGGVSWDGLAGTGECQSWRVTSTV